jgi:leucine dehydrogenase
MAIFDHPEFDHHEDVLFCHDAKVGLVGIIAVHSTALGPAAGGCRVYPYASTDDALTDVLRLSKGMSYKNAAAGLPLGGGKCVIVADPTRPDKPDLLRAMAEHVQALGGRYWTAIDVGMTPAEADILAERSDYVFTRASQYPDGFNPSHFTALGGFVGIRAVVKHTLGRDDLEGIRVAVQGVGSTGSDLSRRLHEAGAILTVADVNQAAVDAVVEAYGATAADPETIHAADVDVFAPCAMGAILNDRTIPELRAKAVCGLANNQLAEPRHAQMLKDRGITYVPDYVVNAGGVIGSSTVIFTTPNREESIERIEGLYDTILHILEQADAENRLPSELADELAISRIQAAS